MTPTKDQLVALARQTAAAHGLAAELVCAVCEQESGWNTFAIRYERAFYAKYIAPMLAANKLQVFGDCSHDTEAQGRAMSWGLMQLMGEDARERGFGGEFLSNLCDPWAGLEFGCRELANRIAAAGGDTTKGLELWNGGGNPNYASEVLARVPGYQESAT